MSGWIRVIDEDDAQGELKEIYDWVRKSRGSLSNVMKVHSLDPESIRLHMNLYLHLMFGKSSLTRLEREMIAVTVSEINKCNYCITHHGEAVVAHAKENRVLEKLEKLEFSEFSSRDRAMLSYTRKLTQNPETVLKSDVDHLRVAGLSDAEILRINLIVSYFNFVNRVVSGLGVQLEEREARVYRY